MRRHRTGHGVSPAVLGLGWLLLLWPASAAPPSQEAVALRNLGLAQLENERPGEAEATFRRLVELIPEDPLGHANLAVAALRQQKTDEALAAIQRALERAPGRGDLLAIQGEILAWSGSVEAAVEVLVQAAESAPNDLEVLYALYRHAGTSRGQRGEAVMETTLERLARLRPENLVLLLQQGRRGVESGDRATASRALLRVRELLWQAPPVATTLLEQALAALEAGDAAAARAPTIRLENFLKSTPMFKSSLGELYTAIQGIPVERFVEEPPVSSFGEPLEVRFEVEVVDTRPTRGSALAVADFDGDGGWDAVRALAQDPVTVEIRRSRSEWRQGEPLSVPSPAAPEGLATFDLDNDGLLDLLGYGGDGPVVLWRGSEDGFVLAGESFGLQAARARAVAVFDFDSEGDLDLVSASPAEGPLEIYRNALEGPLQAVGKDALPQLRPREVYQLVTRDLDRDGDLDLLVAHRGGLTWLDNLRQGRFRNRSAVAGLRDVGEARGVAARDLDNDGWPDLVVAGEGLSAWRNQGGTFTPWPLEGLPRDGSFHQVLAFDADNDGRRDLAAVGEGGVIVLGQSQELTFRPVPIAGELAGISVVVARDTDRDGDLDLVAAGASGLLRLVNQGGNRNHWLRVRLRGLNKGNDKNNVFGLGASVEVRVGRAYQHLEASETELHFGLGSRTRADLMRVVWTNGVPQNRIRPEVDQWVVEEQVLKGSCPFLYTWDGEEVEFVTDLLWGAPLGMPVAPGVWAGADPRELVRVDGARPRDGVWDLRITEELWEAAFFDFVRLHVVDHPEDVEVATSARVIPDQVVEDRVVATRDVRPVAAAWDGRGREVTERLARRDDVYADGYPVGDYQGVAPRPWSLTFDLGAAPASPVRLVLDGWIFPADASLNLAVAQRPDLVPMLTRLEVQTGKSDRDWEVLVEPMGFPPGKTKTMIVDTPRLPPGARKLRIVTTRWLSWDRVAWSVKPDDDAAVSRAVLAPRHAELRYRGFSALVRRAPNAPHTYDYGEVSRNSPWLPFAGRYTRYGDVGPLLLEVDDQSVILGAGDELRLTFDASSLPAPRPGWTRTVFLESHGWDKDADRNTYEARQLEPLPFSAMSGYPYGPGESFPRTPEHERYRREWLTREVRPPGLWKPAEEPGTPVPSVSGSHRD